MTYKHKISIDKDIYAKMNIMREKYGFKSYGELLRLSLYSYELQNETDLDKIAELKNLINLGHEKISRRFDLAVLRKHKAEEITIVKNTYRFIWMQLNHNYARIDTNALIENIGIQIKICELHNWEFPKKQLEDLRNVIQNCNGKENYVILNEIRNLLSR